MATLERGQKLLDELLEAAAAPSGGRAISGGDAFMLYDTYGFPLELTQELAEARGVTVDDKGFEAEMEAQRQRSKDSRWGRLLPRAPRRARAGCHAQGSLTSRATVARFVCGASDSALALRAPRCVPCGCRAGSRST